MRSLRAMRRLLLGFLIGLSSCKSAKPAPPSPAAVEATGAEKPTGEPATLRNDGIAKDTAGS